VRAGSYDQGRDRPNRDANQRDPYQRDSNQQGRSGRFTGYGDFGQGDYSGGRGGMSQDRFRGGESAGRIPGSGGGYGGGSRSFSGYGYEGSSSRGQDDSRGQTGSRNQNESSRYNERFSQTGYGGYGGASGWSEPYGESRQRDWGGQHSGQTGAGSSHQSGNQYGYGGSGIGQHYGKGPKGYQRSDERIKEMISERLHDDPEIDASEVSITVQGGKVTLDGTVDSRHCKNAIEDIAEQFGVQDVQNNLRVQKTSSMNAGNGGDTQSTTFAKQNKH
jgi:osmotically-inducible protein OsmY